ncbi:unnamed protein product [Tuber aestivum]|uniref:L-ornithine N(5)-oxygenase n=1 Tax=Tuber aestivum TaxID=59557 RepID=A0A292PX39_9PEZI|nr:unnamed protein product [Tuber aestivum]
MTSTHFDVIIVGAGPFGIIAAKTYLELNPIASLALLETDTSLGGAWSKSRIYPGMYSQSPLGMIEFSDVPMKPTPQHYKNCVPAHHVHEYLASYVATHIYDGKSIRDRIHLDTRVVSVQKWYGPPDGAGNRSGRGGSAWVVGTDRGQTIICSKIMIAGGITSRPYIPFFNAPDFTPPILHTEDSARLAPTLMEPGCVRNVIVIGGSKSAIDAVHMFISAGKQVDWIISDKGSDHPGMCVAGRAPVYFKRSHRILSTRLMSKLSPCIFQPPDGWMRFFHQTRVGRWTTNTVWSTMQSAWLKAARYGRSGDMSSLRPQLPMFWRSDDIGVSNPHNFWRTMSQANVHRSSIDRVENSSVVLANTTTLPCDLLIMSTSWEVTFPFFAPADASTLGLPQILEAAADRTILSMFPKLARPPNFDRHPVNTTQFYIYRGIVSPRESREGDNSIVFLGQVGAAQSFHIAETQSIWAAAYLMGKLRLPSVEEMEMDIALTNAWRRRRYLSVGERKLTFMHDELAYVSMLLRDLGINHKRKYGRLKELFQPYSNKDYRGMLEEWRMIQKEREQDGETETVYEESRTSSPGIAAL